MTKRLITAKEAADFMRQVEYMENKPGRLVGDITHGFYYMSEDEYKEKLMQHEMNSKTCTEARKHVEDSNMKNGTRVVISDSSNAYIGKYRGYTGVYRGKYPGGRTNDSHMVALDAARNPNSKSGYFFFKQQDIIEYYPIDPEKTETINKTKGETNTMQIKKVIFNDPATIVYWTDGSKTVVYCGENDIYDPEKGLAMAIAKKALGNKGNYFNVFKKWVPKEETSKKSEETTNQKTIIADELAFHREDILDLAMTPITEEEESK